MSRASKSGTVSGARRRSIARGQITIGEIPPIERAALAAVGKKVHVALLSRDGETMGRYGFEFLGYKIKRGNRPMRLPDGRIKSGAKAGALYAYPREKSVRRFKDRIRRQTPRKAPVTTIELIQQINPVVRGWGEHFKRAHVRSLFNQLDRWIVRRIWSHRFQRWRCRGWCELPTAKLYGELGLVNLTGLIPSLATRASASS